MNVGILQDRGGLGVFIPIDVYFAAMELAQDEKPEVIFDHTLTGLTREDLIEAPWSYGPPDHIAKQIHRETKSAGLRDSAIRFRDRVVFVRSW